MSPGAAGATARDDRKALFQDANSNSGNSSSSNNRRGAKNSTASEARVKHPTTSATNPEFIKE
jgi:hypothetical protein